jgi:gluconate kinase
VVLVITGAAATGKSTIGDRLRARPGLLVVDGDVLGRGAAATAYGRRDYVGFWRFVLAVCGEVRSNGLVPVVPCICLPDQVLAAATDEVVHFLALVSDEQTVRRRIAERHGVSDVPSPETHVQFDRTLRGVTYVPEPHTWSRLDVSVVDLAHTVERGAAWAADHAGIT